MPPGRAPKKKVRILIADREGVFRLGLKKLFALEDDLRVVAQADNGEQVAALATTFKPHLLFVQAEMMAEGDGNLLSNLRRELPQSRIVITSSSLTDEDTSRYVKAGASGVILKSADPALFVKSARKVMQDELWVPARQVAHMAKLLETQPEQPPRPVETLTRQEKTIISYLLQGCRNRDIARSLSIKEQTVKNHLRTIYDKVGVSDRLELVLYAIHQRLDLPPVEPVAAQS